MSFSSKLKKSRFILSCIFLTGYTAYTVYAIYYYRTFANTLSIILLTLIGVAFGLSAFITFTSYRINLKPNLFSLIIAAISIPVLLWGLLVNVLAEFIDHIFAGGFGRRYFVPTLPRDANGNIIDLTEVIAKVDGAARQRKELERALRRSLRKHS